MNEWNLCDLGIDLEATGKNISYLMQKNRVTSKMLAETLGISVQSISKWRHGVSLPSIDNFLILGKIFNMSIEDILVQRYQLKDGDNSIRKWEVVLCKRKKRVLTIG